ncbi:MAG: hypothetical protein JWL77_5117 [Chthonomonadaceae bacterium]|nr:hypothetical protein [Chthonomonadaceae bacterium]
MKEPGMRTRQALLLGLGAAALAGANALGSGASPESSRELSGLALEVLGAALLSLGLCGLLLPRAQLLWSRDLRVATQALRLLMLLGVVAVSGFGLWIGAVDFREIRALQTEGRTAQAQIITIQTVGAPSTTLRHVGYAFRVGPTVTTGQLDLTRSELKNLRMGAPLVVTYLPSQPQTYRLGRVDSARVLRRGAMLALFVLRGFAWFGLPFLYLETQRRRLQKGRSSASTGPAQLLPTQ